MVESAAQPLVAPAPDWTMPRARKAVARVSVRPTERRRGAHSERGRPISVSAIGETMSSPARSPIHHVAQVKIRSSFETAPVRASAAVARLGTTKLLTVHAARKRMTSPGAVSVSGQRTRRRTSPAPSAACSADAMATTTGTTNATTSRLPRAATKAAITAKAASATPASMRRPNTSTAARAIPEAGLSGEAKPGGFASHIAARPAAAQASVVAISGATRRGRALGAGGAVAASPPSPVAVGKEGGSGIGPRLRR